MPGSTTSMTSTSATVISAKITSSAVPSITVSVSPTSSGATLQLVSRWTLLMSLLTIFLIINKYNDDNIF